LGFKKNAFISHVKVKPVTPFRKMTKVLALEQWAYLF